MGSYIRRDKATLSAGCKMPTSVLLSVLCFLIYNNQVVYCGEEDFDPCKADGFIQGDIAVTKDQLVYRRTKRAATGFRNRLWKDGVIPYQISDEYNGDQKATIMQAIRHWENNTCLTFVERNMEKDFIYFHQGRCGCCSYVGRKRTGKQGISIGKNCDKFGIVVHEIGHVVGFWHEHTRPDRNSYVIIMRQNIKKGEEHNFMKLSGGEIDSRNEPYDYGSIMHYGKNTFSKAVSLETIIARKRPMSILRPQIGQREKLSRGDIRQTKKMYHCPACGRTLLEPTGSFTSPGFPKDFYLNQLCEWRIHVTPGERVALNFTYFNLEKGPSKRHSRCKVAYVELRDGHARTSPLIGRFCGKRVPRTVWSSGSRLWVKFRTERRAKRGKKYGFRAMYKAVCGGLVTKSEGTIQSPNYPDFYPSNKKCVWSIKVPKGSTVGLSFVTFDMEYHDKCLYDYLQVFDGPDEKSPSLGRFCGKKLPKDLKGNSNKLTIKFVADESINKPGFSLNFVSEKDECLFNNGGCAHKCHNTIGKFHCSCKPGYELHSNGKDCEVACGGILNQANGTLNSPSFPARYPSNKRCLWKIIGAKGKHISLMMTYFDLEGNDGACRYDFVEVRDRWNKVLGKYCGNKLPQTITSLTHIMWVEFRSDQSQSRKGFSAIYYADKDECAKNNGGCLHDCVNTVGSYRCTCRTGFVLQKDGHSCKEVLHCSSTFNTLTGAVVSPNYPGHYGSNKDCTWKIVTTPGSHVELTFRTLDLKDSVGCNHDYVEALSGTGLQARSLGRFCGKVLPTRSLVSRAHKMVVKFHSRNYAAKRGFKARFTSVCGAHLYASKMFNRTFYSHPKYGGSPYSPKMNCAWLITTKPGSVIQLSFKEFEVEKEQHCGYDYLDIRNGNSSSSPLLGKLCGQVLPRQFESTGNQLYLKFVTDDTTQKKGFIAEYKRKKKFRN